MFAFIHKPHVKLAYGDPLFPDQFVQRGSFGRKGNENSIQVVRTITWRYLLVLSSEAARIKHINESADYRVDAVHMFWFCDCVGLDES
uniref:Uncharacterized protein n=1 Tax=Strigamia maritima TaxID=126957 RepID=T1J5U0_STRMM